MMSEDDEIEENEASRHLGREQLARSLLRYLNADEISKLNDSEKTNSHAVLERFEAVYESGFLKMRDGGSYGKETCSCGHDILYIYFIVHKCSGHEIMVGSKCILRFDYRLKKAMAIKIREEEYLKNPTEFCRICKKRNKQAIIILAPRRSKKKMKRFY